ncbi:MAG: VOC family protein [Natronomonas sp.]
MQPESFFHVALNAEDVETTAAFYREAFDATQVDGGDDPEYVAFEVADKRLYVFDEAPYEKQGLTEELPTGVLHFGYTVADIDAAAEELRAAGAEFFMEPETFSDLRIAFFRDPDGTRVELIEEL